MTDRKRKVRSVTLDDGVVAYAKRVGKTIMPPKTHLSQIIDEALVEWAEKRDKRKGGK